MVLAAVLVVAVVALLVDQGVRRDERAAVARCAQAAGSAVDHAHGKVTLMANYVRPALGGSPPPELRSALYGSVSDAAKEAVGAVRAAAATCGNTPVLAIHEDLRERKDACDESLAEVGAYLAAVTRDGRAAFAVTEPRTSPVTAGRTCSPGP